MSNPLLDIIWTMFTGEQVDLGTLLLEYFLQYIRKQSHTNITKVTSMCTSLPPEDLAFALRFVTHTLQTQTDCKVLFHRPFPD